jgi:hypothetical protein
MATPFVQGRLRQDTPTFTIETTCAQSGQPLHIEINADLQFAIAAKEASPLIFLPSVNFRKLKDPSIIDAF